MKCTPLPIPAIADNLSEDQPRGFDRTFLPSFFTKFCLRTIVGKFIKLFHDLLFIL